MKNIKKYSFYSLALTFLTTLVYAFNGNKDTSNYLVISIAIVAGLLAIKNSKHLTTNG